MQSAMAIRIYPLAQTACTVPNVFSGRFESTVSTEGKIAVFDLGYFYYDYNQMVDPLDSTFTHLPSQQQRIDLFAYQGGDVGAVSITIWEDYQTVRQRVWHLIELNSPVNWILL